ncbi:hypothetical protein SCLCIDRAFT_28501 [Scleroderma citrinum Foug A]|uniref:Uncharacterized protein n=1 Tax=Scleroderma citrinum Foug A TaxID=1036808 RepID=A0A0C2ZZJ9_9AGAM|nr:hypothetical protein SCLCIDRAFT_28501 [Scleroderma citrinum Foug A]
MSDTQDPCTSSKALVQGTSAKSTEMTLVVLKSVPHEMQNWLQNSLPLTPRLPIEGEPDVCKQEAADSVVTVGCTNGMVKMAKPMIMDIDEKAVLGGELVERVHKLDKGDGDCEYQFANTFIAAIEHADGLGMSNETANVKEVRLKGCREGTSKGASVDKAAAECCQQLGTADGDPGREDECRDTPNELMQLLMQTAELYVKSSGDILHVYLTGTTWHAGNPNRPGHGTDSQRGLTDALSMPNDPETASMSHRDSARMYLGTGDVKCIVHKMDGVESQSGTLIWLGDIQSTETDVILPVNEAEIITAKAASDEPNGFGNQMDMLSLHTDAYSTANEMKMAANETECISMHQMEVQMKNSPEMFKIVTPKPIRQWRKFQAKSSSLDDSRALERQLHQMLKARELLMAMEIEMETVAVWMAQQAAAAFTQHK